MLLKDVFAFVAVVTLLAACGTDSVPVPVQPEWEIQTKAATTESCETVSGILDPGAPLILSIGEEGEQSRAIYLPGSVLEPTLVSFGICDNDTIGTTLAPKAQAFGPISRLFFLQEVCVNLWLGHAGLIPRAPDNVRYKVLRRDEATGNWNFHQSGRIAGRRVIYGIIQNGTYALSLDSTVIGEVSPTDGGMLSLFGSRLVVPPDAVDSVMGLSFSIWESVPEGLPNALERIYEFYPDGTDFEIPAVLDVAFSDAGFGLEESLQKAPSYNASRLWLYYFDEEDHIWELQREVQIDWMNRRLSVQLEHFSRYAFGR